MGLHSEPGRHRVLIGIIHWKNSDSVKVRSRERAGDVATLMFIQLNAWVTGTYPPS